MYKLMINKKETSSHKTIAAAKSAANKIVDWEGPKLQEQTIIDLDTMKIVADRTCRKSSKRIRWTSYS